jgi:putative PEP-CTERM system TPR-repeat lipoprotein
MNRLIFITSFALSLSGCSPSAEDLIKKGEAALNAGDNASALIHLRSAVATNAASLPARELLARAFETAGDFQASEQQLRKQLELGGVQDSLIPQIAAWLIDRNENAALIKEFGEVALSTPEGKATLASLISMAFAAQRRLPDAERALAKAGSITASTQLAAAQLQFNKGSAEAGKVLLADAERFASESKVTPWWVWRGIARGWQGAGEQQKSLASFDTAIKSLPSHFGIKGELGEYFMALEKTDEAKAILKDLKSTAPKYYRTALLEALIKIDEGKQDEAYELATRVLAQVPDSESASLIAANIDLARGNLSTAESRAQVLIQQTPNSIGGQRLNAIIEARKGNAANAERLLQKALSIVGNNPGLMVDLAQQKLNLGKTNEAKKLLEAAILLKPDSAAALTTLADLLMRSGSASDVAPYLKKALVSAKTDIGAMQALFNLAIKTKQYDQASVAIDKTSEAKPNDPNPTLWKAILAKEKNDDAQANTLLLASLDQSPTFYPALTLLKAESLSGKNTTNNSAEFEKRLAAAIATKPKDARIYLDMLALKRRQKMDPKQLSALGQKFILDLPEAVALRKTVAELLLASDEKKVADSIIEQGYTSFSSTPGMLELAARWAEASGQNGIALTRYEQLNKFFPENLGYALKRGQLLFATQRPDEGIEVFKKAVALRPEDDLANRELAFALFKQGKKPESFSVLTQYANQNGKSVQGLLAAADVQFFAKDFAESLKSIEKAVKIEPSERTLGAKIRFLDARDDKKEAEKTLAAWLKLNPNDPTVLLFAASRASQQNQTADTINYLERLLKITPGNPYLLNDLAFAQASLGSKQALQSAELANRALPDQSNILDTLAFAQTVNGKLDEAEKTLKQALQTDPNAIAPLVRLAELLKSRNNIDEAKQLLLNLDVTRLPKAFQERVKAI